MLSVHLQLNQTMNTSNDTNIDPNDGKIYSRNYGKADINSTSVRDFPQIGRIYETRCSCNTP